jgi:hypothetical protein
VEGDDHVENLIDQNSPMVEPMEEEGAELDREQIVATRFERDPDKRSQILELLPDQQDEARRFYILI